MKHYIVDSSHLSSVAWEDGVLEVQFTNGHMYRYQDVPEANYVELVNASSPGKYLHQHIVGRFRHRKM